jgi:hypothetical protein
VAERELRESLEEAVEDDGEETTQCVIQWFVKCITILYKWSINPVHQSKTHL